MSSRYYYHITVAFAIAIEYFGKPFIEFVMKSWNVILNLVINMPTSRVCWVPTAIFVSLLSVPVELLTMICIYDEDIGHYIFTYVEDDKTLIPVNFLTFFLGGWELLLKYRLMVTVKFASLYLII